MSSGVAVNSECPKIFQKMAEGKKEFRYIVFKIQDKEIVVEKTVKTEELKCAGVDDYEDNSKAAYEEFLGDLKTITNGFKDCRYAVFDFKFKGYRDGAGSSHMDKIIFMQICPDDASVKSKMVYASSAGAIKQALNTGKIMALQVCDEASMNHRDLIDKLSDKFSDKIRS